MNALLVTTRHQTGHSAYRVGQMAMESRPTLAALLSPTASAWLAMNRLMSLPTFVMRAWRENTSQLQEMMLARHVCIRGVLTEPIESIVVAHLLVLVHPVKPAKFRPQVT